MKRYIVPSVLAFLLIGCGSTSVDSNSVEKTDNQTSSIPPNFTGYILSDYLLPSSSQTVKMEKYLHGVFQQEESLTYEASAGITVQRSLQNLEGLVEYQEPSNGTIAVTIYESGNSKQFSINEYISIGTSVTVESGTCTLSKHYDNLKFEASSFSDVLEISCPKSVGYYQKGKGLVLENVVDTTLQTSSTEMTLPTSPNPIGRIDNYQPSRSFVGYNIDSAKQAQVDKLWDAPYYLSGMGMKIGLVDGGAVLDTHVELRDRVFNWSNEDTDLHTTHVAGTLIAEGGHLPKAKGFAYEAELYAASYHDINFAESVVEFARHDVFVSNHSYGVPGSDDLGAYMRYSQELDRAIQDNPYMLAVMAAGNDGNKYLSEKDYTEWSLIKDGSNAKNVITVGAIDNESNNIANFSSKGPVKGGRLKPDIAVDGANVLSTSNYDDTAYKRMDGTSMAAPAATGTIALLSQRYGQVNGGNIQVDTMKAVLFNTAVDIENVGPDYKSGFGHIDAYEAVKVIDSMQSDDTSLVKLETIREGENQRYSILSTSYEDFKVTLAWVDSEGSNLVNDIDMYLVEENTGQKIYPYTLNESSPNSIARQDRQNRVDPQEQISYRLKPGSYTLHLNGYKINTYAQKFSLVSTKTLGEVEKDVILTPMDTHIHKVYASIL